MPNNGIYDSNIDDDSDGDTPPNFITNQQTPPVPPKPELPEVKLGPKIGTLESLLKEKKTVINNKLNTVFPEPLKLLLKSLKINLGVLRGCPKKSDSTKKVIFFYSGENRQIGETLYRHRSKKFADFLQISKWQLWM